MDYQVPAGSPSSSAICSAMLPKQPAWTWPHGWVSVTQLIQRVNATGKYRLDRAALEESVIADDKGRFLFGANRGQVWTGLRNPQRFECVRKE